VGTPDLRSSQALHRGLRDSCWWTAELAGKLALCWLTLGTDSLSMAIPDDPNSPLEDEVAPLWKWAIRAIGLLGGLLAAIFAWVQLREIPLPLLENADPLYVRRIILAIYYACWVGGTTVDANIQKEVYRRDPQLGNVPREATLAVVGLFAVAALLLWASSSDERTSLALGPFLVVNVIGWRVLVHRVSPIIAATAAAYEQKNRYYRLEQLNVIKAYISGWWQWARFALMALIVVVTNLACFNDAARAFLSHALGNLMPTMREDAIANLLPVAGLLLFVVVAETWIWILRARNAIALRTIAALATKYTLRPRGEG